MTISHLRNAPNSTKFYRIVVRNKDYQKTSRTTNMEAKGDLERRY